MRTERILKSKKQNTEENEENFEEPSDNEETRYQERQLNYIVEFSLLIDSDVISKYCFLLKRYKDNRDDVNF